MLAKKVRGQKRKSGKGGPGPRDRGKKVSDWDSARSIWLEPTPPIGSPERTSRQNDTNQTKSRNLNSRPVCTTWKWNASDWGDSARAEIRARGRGLITPHEANLGPPADARHRKSKRNTYHYDKGRDQGERRCLRPPCRGMRTQRCTAKESRREGSVGGSEATQRGS